MRQLTREQLVNPVVKGFCEVLKETAGLEVVERESSTHHATSVTLEVTVLVGVVGAVEGQISYSLSKHFACQLASTMLCDEITEYDEMAESAVGELGNMITGRAAVEFQHEGLDCDLCPPSIIVAEKVEISANQIDTIMIPFCSDWGDIEVHIALTPAPGKKRSAKDLHPTPTITGIITADSLMDDIKNLFANGEYEKALEQTRTIRELNFACSVKLAPLCTDEGLRLYEDGQTHVALRVLEAAVEYDEFNYKAHLYLGHCYYAREAWHLALHNYQKAAGIEPKEPECYYWAGCCLEKLGNIPKAKRALQVAAKFGHDKAQEKADSLPDDGPA